jgi:hypothetical protein
MVITDIAMTPELENLTMIAKKTLAAAILALGTLVAVPANAGGISVEFGFGGPGHHWSGGPGWHQEKMSTREVRRMLRHRDYRNIDFVDRRGPTYEVTARKNGRSFYLVVNAYTGEIVHRHRI